MSVDEINLRWAFLSAKKIRLSFFQVDENFSLDYAFLLHLADYYYTQDILRSSRQLGHWMEAFEGSEKNGFIKFWGLGQFYTYSLTIAIFHCNDTKRCYEEDRSVSTSSYKRIACNNCRAISNPYLWNTQSFDENIRHSMIRGMWAKLLKSFDN